jgi:hypothetical protein
MISTADFKLCGHSATGPTGVDDQSLAYVAAPSRRPQAASQSCDGRVCRTFPLYRLPGWQHRAIVLPVGSYIIDAIRTWCAICN